MGITLVMVWSFLLDDEGNVERRKEWAATGAPPRGIHVMAFRFIQWPEKLIFCSTLQHILNSAKRGCGHMIC